MPEPLPLRKVLGPSVILAGVGVGSGEYILWPTSRQRGHRVPVARGGRRDAAVLPEHGDQRYTLATGETAIAGFAR